MSTSSYITNMPPPWPRIREEATGYGLVYFVEEMLRARGNSLSGKVVAISGSGNVAQFAAEKALLVGAKVVTLSALNT